MPGPAQAVGAVRWGGASLRGVPGLVYRTDRRHSCRADRDPGLPERGAERARSDSAEGEGSSGHQTCNGYIFFALFGLVLKPRMSQR